MQSWLSQNVWASSILGAVPNFNKFSPKDSAFLRKKRGLVEKWSSRICLKNIILEAEVESWI